jgi:hypothetical protein
MNLTTFVAPKLRSLNLWGSCRRPILIATSAVWVFLFLVPAQALALPLISGPVNFGDFSASTTGSHFFAQAGTDVKDAALPAASTRASTLNQSAHLSAAASDPSLGDATAKFDYTASVNGGILHLNASGSAFVFPGSLGIAGFFASSGAVFGDVAWWDTIKITGDGTLFISVHAIIQELSALANAGVDFIDTLEVHRLTAGGGISSSILVADICNSAGTIPPETLPACQLGPAGVPLQVQFGDQLEINNQLDFEAISGASFPTPSGSFTLNLADSSYFTIDPQTPGASYITGSGIDYRSSVFPPSTTVQIPEPTTLALLGLAFAGMGWARRRKLN